MAEFSAVVLTITVLVLALVIIAHLARNAFSKTVRKAEALLMRTLVQDEEPASKLINYYTQATGTNQYNASAISVKFVADKFLQLFEAKYPETRREVVTRFCSLDQRACQTIYKVVTDIGNTIMISFSWEPITFIDPKSRPLWAGKGFKLDEQYLFGDDNNPKFSYASGMEIAFPAGMDYNHSDILDLVELVRQCEVERISYETRKRMTRMFQLTHTFGGYNVVPYAVEIAKQSREYMNLAYSEVEISFEGEKHKLPMADAMDFSIEAIKDGQNMYLLGAPGVGKTTWLEQLQTRLVHDESDINVLNITAGTIDELQSVQAQSDFKDALAQLVHYGGLNVICIDEAESVLTQGETGIHSKVNSLMLQMLSGSLQRQLNCVCVLIFNARPEQLNPAVFRNGRLGVMYDLGALPQEQGGQLVDLLKQAMPEKAFDSNQYNKFVSEKSQLPNGMVYAEKGKISLADVYACFMERERRSMLIDMLRKKAGKPPLLDTYPKRDKNATPGEAPTVAKRIARPPKMVIIEDVPEEAPAVEQPKAVKPRVARPPAQPVTEIKEVKTNPQPKYKKDRRRNKRKGR